MDYLDTLKNITDSVNDSKEFIVSHKLIMLDLISREEENVTISQDVFIYFYEDVINSKLKVDFKTALTEPVYSLAQGDAQNCVNTKISITKLEEDSTLYTWLQNAIRFTDHLALHYLQVILTEAPVKQGDAGTERSRYIQINQKKNDAEKAGRILDNLYDCRNKIEHRTVSDPSNPGFQKMLTPNYKRAKRQILKRYPEALECFQDSFENFHN
jgi:hypothetical protein